MGHPFIRMANWDRRFGSVLIKDKQLPEGHQHKRISNPWGWLGQPSPCPQLWSCPSTHPLHLLPISSILLRSLLSINRAINWSSLIIIIIITKRIRSIPKEKEGMGHWVGYHWNRRRHRWKSQLPAPQWSGSPATSPASSSSGTHPSSLQSAHATEIRQKQTKFNQRFLQMCVQNQKYRDPTK